MLYATRIPPRPHPLAAVGHLRFLFRGSPEIFLHLHLLRDHLVEFVVSLADGILQFYLWRT